MITRRQFLIGGSVAGAVAVAGGGAAVATHQEGVHRFLHGHGLLGGPDRAIPSVDVPVEFGEFESAAARKKVGFGLSLPAVNAEAALICLHGRGGNHHDPFTDLGVHRFVAAAGLSWAVAAVDGGESFWHRRADGSDTQRLVLEELLPMVQSKAPNAKPLLIGWSMGAYGALLMAEQHPSVFAGLAASSPAVWHNAGEAEAGAFDDASDFSANDVLGRVSSLTGNQIRIDCGADDIFVDVSRELLERAPGSSGGIHDGYHESPTWRSFLPDQLEFLRGRL